MEFEKKIKKLETLVEKLSAGKLSLERLSKTFEEGLKLSKECEQDLDKAELKVKKLLKIKSNGEPLLEKLEDE